MAKGDKYEFETILNGYITPNIGDIIPITDSEDKREWNGKVINYEGVKIENNQIVVTLVCEEI